MEPNENAERKKHKSARKSPNSKKTPSQASHQVKDDGQGMELLHKKMVNNFTYSPFVHHVISEKLIDILKKYDNPATSEYYNKPGNLGSGILVERPEPSLPPSPISVNTSAFLDIFIESVATGTTFPELAPQLSDVSREFRRQLAAKLEPALNAHIQTMPHDDLDGKKRVCEFVEKALEPLGLAVKVPNTPGLPGKLKATTGHWPGIGRFVFEVYSDGKQRRPAVSDTLPLLELIDASPATEPQAPWQDKVGPKSNRTGRKRS